MHNCTPIMALAALFAIVQAPLTSEAAGENKLEVFSWWTSGGEAAALNGLFNVYKKQKGESFDNGRRLCSDKPSGNGASPPGAAAPVNKFSATSVERISSLPRDVLIPHLRTRYCSKVP